MTQFRQQPWRVLKERMSSTHRKYNGVHGLVGLALVALQVVTSFLCLFRVGGGSHIIDEQNNVDVGLYVALFAVVAGTTGGMVLGNLLADFVYFMADTPGRFSPGLGGSKSVHIVRRGYVTAFAISFVSFLMIILNLEDFATTNGEQAFDAYFHNDITRFLTFDEASQVEGLKRASMLNNMFLLFGLLGFVAAVLLIDTTITHIEEILTGHQVHLVKSQADFISLLMGNLNTTVKEGTSARRSVEFPKTQSWR